MLGIDQTKMRVGVQGDADIRMAHQILEGVRIHSLLGFLAAVGVPADMRSDLRRLHPVDLVVLLSDVLKILFPVPDDFSAEDTALRRIRQQS